MENQQKQRIINKLRRLAKLIEDDNSEVGVFETIQYFPVSDETDFERLLDLAILDTYPDADKQVELEFNPPYRYVSYEGELGFTWDLSGDLVGTMPSGNNKLQMGQVVDGDGAITDLYVIW